MVTTAPSTYTPVYWMTPSDLAQDFADLFSGDPGVNVASNTKDFFLGPLSDGLKWVSHIFGCPTDPYVRTLDTISSGLAIPNFFFNLGQLRNAVQQSDSSSREVVRKGLLTTTAASESAEFFHTTGVAPLGKEALQTVRGLFWTPLMIFSSMEIFDRIQVAEALGADINSTKEVEEKEILQHRLSHNFLSIAKSVTVVAMASIALVSILFASMAQGILFSPITFLALSTGWIILNYVTYFYEQMIDRWDLGISKA